MSSIREEDFIKVLSEIGYSSSNVSWKWLIDHKPTEEFIIWMCENIYSSNYLSDEDLNEYKKLEDSGQVLEGEELEKTIYEEIAEHFELPHLNNDYMSELEDELHYIQNYSKSLVKWVDKQQAELLAVESEVSELKNEFANLQKKLVNSQSECLGKSSSLESSLEHLNDQLLHLKKYCLNSGQDVANNRFLSEIPIDGYFKECAEFSRELDMNMEQIISSGVMEKHCDISTEEIFRVKLKKAKKGLQDTLLLRVEETARRKGLESACEYIKGLLESRQLWKFSTDRSRIIQDIAEQKIILQRLEARNTQYGSILIKIQSSAMEPCRDLEEAVTKYANKQCMSLEDLHKELQFHQKQAICDKLRKLGVVLKNQCVTDLVWLFLLGEEVTEILNLYELAKSGEAFLIQEQQDRILRIESMKHVEERKNCEIGTTETWCLLDALLSYFKISREMLKFDHTSVNSKLLSSEDIFCSLKLLVEYIEKYEADNMKLELSMKEMSYKVISALKNRCKELADMKSLVCSGSTENYPALETVNQQMFWHHPDPVSKKLMRRFENLLAKYQAEKQRRSVLGTAGSLWKTFLTNPEKIKELIKNVNNPVVLLNDEVLICV